MCSFPTHVYNFLHRVIIEAGMLQLNARGQETEMKAFLDIRSFPLKHFIFTFHLPE